MRWERLFEDLEAQLTMEVARDRDLEAADRFRAEIARVRMADRWAPAIGLMVTVRVLGAGVVHGAVQSSGPDWVLLAERPGEDTLVPASAVVAVTGLGRRARAPEEEGAILARLGLGYALAGVARDRARVSVTTIDGVTIAGTIDRVGADLLEMVEHPLEEFRRAASVSGVWTLPFAGLAVIRRDR